MDFPARALVLGFQRTGQSVARMLAGHGVRVTVADRQPAAALGIDAAAWPNVTLRLGEDGTALVDAVDLVVPSPGVPREAPPLRRAVARGVPVRAEIDIAAQGLRCPIVAITGTNGKSTTTSLVGMALAASGRATFTGGNLGTPLIEAVETAPDIAVAEVSSFQLEWITCFRPAVGALLNVTPDHLDRHATYAEYRDLKRRLFSLQTADDVAVLNRDNPDTWATAPLVQSRVVAFGRAEAASGCWLRDRTVVWQPASGGEETYDLTRTPLVGRHNDENILAAVAVARTAGAVPAAVQQAIDGIAPLRHRLAFVAERRGVRWFDDSKATNVGAAVRSLESFDAPVILVAGGVDKGGDLAPLVHAARGRVRVALLLGAARDRMGTALRTGGIAVEYVATVADAVAAAAATARPGEVVLLAPACSSFDMFASYAERGRAFCAAVEGLR
jgi:UDP-N-acetylmuramoylalanine--D-glutamate ligase